MALYTIIRVYEVPAETKQQATDRMLEAIVLHVEKDFHVKDVIREPGAKPGQGKVVELKPPAGWMTLLMQQLTGKPVSTGWVKPKLYKGKSMHEEELEQLSKSRFGK
jgi:hypothetical protein